MRENDSTKEAREQSVNLAIKVNQRIDAAPCPICGQRTNPNIGAELTLADSDLVVCRDCGCTHAPLLLALLTLGLAATDYHSYEQDFGQMWQAARGNGSQRGVNWNALHFASGERGAYEKL